LSHFTRCEKSAFQKRKGEEDNARKEEKLHCGARANGLQKPKSDRNHVVERFRLSADGLGLDYDITVTDPVILAEPWSWGGSFIFRAEAELKPWNCGVG
jgi:hypothetical protein